MTIWKGCCWLSKTWRNGNEPVSSANKMRCEEEEEWKCKRRRRLCIAWHVLSVSVPAPSEEERRPLPSTVGPWVATAVRFWSFVPRDNFHIINNGPPLFILIFFFFWVNTTRYTHTLRINLRSGFGLSLATKSF